MLGAWLSKIVRPADPAAQGVGARRARALVERGIAAENAGAPDQALQCYREAVEADPDYAAAHYNLGLARLISGENALAEADLRAALRLRPAFPEAWVALAEVLETLGRLPEAEAAYRSAIGLRPAYHQAHYNLGITLQTVGRYAEAEASFRRVLELSPGFVMAWQWLATIKGYQSDFAQVKPLSDTALSLLSADAKERGDIWEMRLYILSYHPELQAEEIYSQFVRWGDLQDCSAAARAHGNERSPRRRLRIGYVSPDFRRHTSRFYFEPLFAHHDRDEVELFAYSNVKLADDYTGRFKALFDHWRDIAAMSDDAAAELVRRDRIDILVDACNHMRDERLGLFARKSAPVQVTWLGSAWTSGLPTIDYVLFDPYLAPAGTLAREAIVRLPRTFVAYRPRDDADPVGEAPCLRNGHVTFGYFGRTERLNHRVFRLWARILAALPQARLILDFGSLGVPATREYFAGFLAEHGVDVTRVTLRYSKHLWPALNEIDIMLDSFPHSGGTMIYDCIWMGVPLLTLAARPP